MDRINLELLPSGETINRISTANSCRDSSKDVEKKRPELINRKEYPASIHRRDFDNAVDKRQIEINKTFEEECRPPNLRSAKVKLARCPYASPSLHGPQFESMASCDLLSCYRRSFKMYDSHEPTASPACRVQEMKSSRA
ncbi:hypothetical protein EVAR_7444_1 [Eumeta japonica]|uniref:Uncharacterized protein n=1 Tax=Eumeta variegata TaxID=151549 RepID=A0A4C1V6F5_EUMVA|nr:hypothetical protein EVAR_7444_1 [Eumeta japonica]